jgi:16S rRNA (uracil1498-N3)-methyltransferase
VSAPRFYAPDSHAASCVTLSADEAHHLRDVLRLHTGDVVHVFDGIGQEWAGRVGVVTRREVAIEVEREVTPAAEPPVRVTLYAGLLKGDQMDAVVRDATMLGVVAIVPLISSHVAVPKRAADSAAAMARWQRVALASVKQCGRAVVPEIAKPVNFEAVIESAVPEPAFICVEPVRSGGDLWPDIPRPTAIRLLIGPEGGWSTEEVAEARRRGAYAISLGPRTLRAETAPIVALTALWTRWGW